MDAPHTSVIGMPHAIMRFIVSQHMAVKRGLALPPDVEPTLQERAWSSPLWYTPAK